MQLDMCGGVDKLERLQQHKNVQVYQKSLGIIETYFTEDSDEDNIIEVIQGDGGNSET